jgi:hypothetical protein
MLLWLYPYVSSVYFKIFQVFHLDVAKIDLDVAYVVMSIHACVFHLFSYV